MEFYKLYHLVHHRTDWPELWRWQREKIMPEWYEEQRRKKRKSVFFTFGRKHFCSAVDEQ